MSSAILERTTMGGTVQCLEHGALRAPASPGTGKLVRRTAVCTMKIEKCQGGNEDQMASATTTFSCATLQNLLQDAGRTACAAAAARFNGMDRLPSGKLDLRHVHLRVHEGPAFLHHLQEWRQGAAARSSRLAAIA